MKLKYDSYHKVLIMKQELDQQISFITMWNVFVNLSKNALGFSNALHIMSCILYYLIFCNELYNEMIEVINY